MTKLATDESVSTAVGFLLDWPGDAVHLTAIHPDTGRIIGQSFDKSAASTPKQLAKWLAGGIAQGFGIYANYNALHTRLGSVKRKAAEADVSAVTAFHVDADVDKSITDPAAFEIAKVDLLERIKLDPMRPNVIIDSGNGFALFWVLATPISVTDENRNYLKRINIALRDAFGGDKCQDLGHVLRVPATVNFPNLAKRKRNRPASSTRVVSDDRILMLYRPEDFVPAPFNATAAAPTGEAIDIPKTVDLSRLNKEFRSLIMNGGAKFGDGTRSALTYAMAADLRREGFTDGEIVSVIINPDYAVSEHILEQKQRDPIAQAMRVIDDLNKKGIVREPTAQEAFAGDEPPKLTEKEARADKMAAIRADHTRKRDADRVGKPLVVVSPATLPRNVREVQAHLIASAERADAATSDQIFQRGGELVHLSRNKLTPRKPGEVTDRSYHVRDDLLIQPATVGWLTDRAMRAITFARPKDDDLVECAVPAKVISTLREITTSWKFPKLAATAETPTLRPDGSVLESFGYDKRSGLFLDTGGIEFPGVKERPTKADALAALALLQEPLTDFPFRDDDGHDGLSKSVQLAAMLTAIVRRSLPIAPTFGFDANEVESGKTTLAQVNAIMMTGRRTGERPFTSDAEEQRKAIGSALLAGDGVILYDNVDVPIEGATLCGVVTDSLFTDRRLGEHSQITAPTCSLILFTGNHLVAKGDMTARVLICKLVPGEALAARKFKYQPLDDYLTDNRPALVHAALTIMRAYIVAGRPRPGATSRFPEWRRLVADPLVWLGVPDPCLAFGRAREADPVRERFAEVLRPWVKLPKPEAWLTTARLMGVSAISQAIGDACGVDPSKLTGRAATEYLKSMVGVNVEGWRLDKTGGTMKHPIVWRLVKS